MCGYLLLIDQCTVTPHNDQLLYEFNYKKIKNIMDKISSDTLILKGIDAAVAINKKTSTLITPYEYFSTCSIVTKSFIELYYIEYTEDIYKYIVIAYTINLDELTDDFVNIINFTHINSLSKNNRLFIKFFNNLLSNHNIFLNRSNKLDDNILIKNSIYHKCASYMSHKMIEQPSEYIKTSLYMYQRANIKYILDRETNIKQIFIPKLPIVEINHKYDYNVIKKSFESKNKSVVCLNINGGCIADDVGLGKTIQMITLCMISNLKTLIIVPKHLLIHWTSEFNKHLTDNATDHYEVYDPLKTKKLSKNIVITDNDNIDDTLKRNHIWHRIIVDEFHELNRLQINSIAVLNSNFKWLMTATPFVNSQITNSLIKIITTAGIWNMQLGKHKEYIEQYAELIRRNTKESIKQELIFPQITNHKYYIDFSTAELNYYHSIEHANEKYYLYIDKLESEETELKLRQFCVNANINMEIADCEEFLTLDNMKPKFVKYFKNIIDEIDEQISKKHLDIAKLIEEKKHIKYTIIKDKNTEIQMVIELDTSLYSYLKDELKNLIDKKKINELSLDRIECKVDNIINSKKYDSDSDSDSDDSDDKEICVVCMGYITAEEKITLLSCGHIYCFECFDCLRRHINSSNRCQICMTSLNNLKIFNIMKNQQYIKYRELINKYGSKISLLISLFAAGKIEGKTIIYSSWGRCLEFLFESLNNNDISTLFPFSENNTYDDIYKFESDDKYKVLLLSSECNASGLNITSAKNIILINPLKGNYIYRKQITNQLIGRVHRIGQISKNINFIEIIIKNTIENKIDSENKIVDSILDSCIDELNVDMMKTIEHAL
jgi:SNF2 family DNA or RNA helicase